MLSSIKYIYVIALLGQINFAIAEPLDASRLQLLIQKATEGEIHAQADLAARYQVGDGVKKDTTQAAFWYQKLAENGVAEAQLTLGLILIMGDGIRQDNQKALHWLNAAAEQRLAPAQYLMGLAYAEGHGVEIDKIKAYMWYEIAAAMDYSLATEAQAELAQQMNTTEITEAEQKAAAWWMRFHH